MSAKLKDLLIYSGLIVLWLSLPTLDAADVYEVIPFLSTWSVFIFIIVLSHMRVLVSMPSMNRAGWTCPPIPYPVHWIGSTI